ncbi:probable ADP-ribosylation factor GTPase-activating protein AGD11 isoform X2 [Gossypium raimondii]|uniref:probable ADP-ribosylation factor GTPase-activating protein AGD11 isoform X2 n=1 Tax=Gossypium raimondii TaxID=29730 RepID=UPI00227A4F3A|nr:probable ADP-ribosylation factor GTPase-activating protein AGD11 isoform X2 [Gossypium raimondii]
MIRSSIWKLEMSTQYEKSDPTPPSGSGSCLYDLLCSDTPRWERPSDSDTTSWLLRKETWRSFGPQARLERLLEDTGNRVCADCGSPDPKWVSLSIGVFICIKCSGVHRSLGSHISKVLSVKLDEWTEDQVDGLVNLGGNIVVNNKRKYEMQQFLEGEHTSCRLQPHHRTPSSTLPLPPGYPLLNEKKHSEKQSRHRIGHRFRNSWGRKDSDHLKISKKSNSLAGMVEFVGLIKVNVVKGTNLAVRDMLSSDPYVILALGHQSVRTRVIKNNLNPVWNESLMLSIPENIPPLRVIVYDKDTFTTDDFMGDAEIDIQPLVAAAKAYEKSEIHESMQLGKCLANRDNNFLKDGIINLADGKVKQEISFRLQNVERGILEIELECVPLTQ